MHSIFLNPACNFLLLILKLLTNRFQLTTVLNVCYACFSSNEHIQLDETTTQRLWGTVQVAAALLFDWFASRMFNNNNTDHIFSWLLLGISSERRCNCRQNEITQQQHWRRGKGHAHRSITLGNGRSFLLPWTPLFYIYFVIHQGGRILRGPSANKESLCHFRSLSRKKKMYKIKLAAWVWVRACFRSFVRVWERKKGREKMRHDDDKRADQHRHTMQRRRQ